MYKTATRIVQDVCIPMKPVNHCPTLLGGLLPCVPQQWVSGSKVMNVTALLYLHVMTIYCIVYKVFNIRSFVHCGIFAQEYSMSFSSFHNMLYHAANLESLLQSTWYLSTAVPLRRHEPAKSLPQLEQGLRITLIGQGTGSLRLSFGELGTAYLSIPSPSQLIPLLDVALLTVILMNNIPILRTRLTETNT